MLLDCFDCKVAHTFKALKIGLFPKKFVRSLIRVDPAMLLDCFDFTINVCAINVCANVCATLQSKQSSNIAGSTLIRNVGVTLKAPTLIVKLHTHLKQSK